MMISRAISKVGTYFSLRHDSSAVIFARHRTAQRQVPLMYLILSINMLSLCVTHLDLAPRHLTVYFPAFLLLLSGVRTLSWLHKRNAQISLRRARNALRITLIFAIVLSAVFVTWSLSLFTYGDAYTKGQVVFFIGVTLTTIITCLMTIRQASAIMFAIVVIPTSLFLITQPEPVFHAIAVNMVLVIGAMIFVLDRANQHFRNSIEKQSELNAANTKIRKIANLDSLTELANRRHFFHFLQTRIEDPDCEKFALVLLDLDGFKPINDVFGHPTGDKTLVEIAARLKNCLPPNSFLARLGGDEFAIIIWETPHQVVVDVIERALGVISYPILFDEGSAVVSATAGIAYYPDAAEEAGLLFERADFALCFAKQEKRGEIVEFNLHHENSILSSANLAKNLREADFEAEFSMVFQPIWDIASINIIGFEALARWNSPSMGAVPPDHFIPAAEQTGLVSKLTKILIGKSLDVAETWPQNLKLGLNLSAVDLCSHEAITQILALIRDRNFDPKRITIEITETAVMRDFERAVQSLNRLRKAGMQIALDDFGSGNSSLSYLQKLPLDHVKIDKSFVQSADQDPRAHEITLTIVRLCSSFGFGCIAEGVETMAQLEMLSKIGCHTLQGFYFAKPMSANQVDQYIAENTAVLSIGFG